MDRDQSIIGIILIAIIILLFLLATGFFNQGAPQPPEEGIAPGGPTLCGFDSDCPPDQMCIDGQCRSRICNSRIPCPPGYICINGMCRDASCTNNADCPLNFICVGGLCQDDSCSADKPCPYGFMCINGHCMDASCQKDADCPAGFICINGFCSDASCETNSDCPFGYECIGGLCTRSEKTPCASDADCPGGQVCKDGFCNPCASDGDCQPGYVCTGGSCQPEGGCTSDADCLQGMECVEGSCEIPGCTSDAECPLGQLCVNGQCITAECSDEVPCPGGLECVNGICTSHCTTTPCTSDDDCGGLELCLIGCCSTYGGISLTQNLPPETSTPPSELPPETSTELPQGVNIATTTSFCEACPANDSIVSRMFIDANIEGETVTPTLIVEKTPGKRDVVRNATIFVQVVAFDLSSKEICKIQTDSAGSAVFNYSYYPVCENIGCTIRFTFCCADVSQGCLIPVCLNDAAIQQHEDVSQCAPAPPGTWAEKAYVGQQYVNIYPAIEEVSIPPKPKLMGAAFAFQVCLPILAIFGLLSAAMFASGRNPFEMFSIYVPRYKRPAERALRPRGMNWNVNAIVGSVVGATQGIIGVASGTVSAKTGASKSEGALPGFTGTGKKLSSAITEIKGVRMAGKSGLAGASKAALAQPATKTVATQKGLVQTAETKGGARQVVESGALGRGALAGIGAAIATVGVNLLLMLLKSSPLFSWLAYGLPITDSKGNRVFEGLKSILDKKIDNLTGAADAVIQAIKSLEASMWTEEKKDKNGNVITYLHWIDPDTGQEKAKAFTPTKNQTVQEQIDAKKSLILAPLLAAMAFVCESMVNDKMSAKREAIEGITKSYEASPEMKKKIDGMSTREYAALEKKLSKGTATAEEAFLAAMIVKEKGASAANMASALASFVGSPAFTNQLDASYELASKGKLAGEKGRIDAAEVLSKGLFVAAVAGNWADKKAAEQETKANLILTRSSIKVDAATGAPIERTGTEKERLAYKHAREEAGKFGGISDSCTGTVHMIAGDSRTRNLVAGTAEGKPLVFAQSREKLTAMLKETNAVAEYSAARQAQSVANANFARAEKEVYYSTHLTAMEALTTERQLTLEGPKKKEITLGERNDLVLSARLTDSAAGIGVISDPELKGRALLERSFDPGGKLIPQAKAIEKAFAAMDASGKKVAADQLSMEYVNGYLANRYYTDAEKMEEIKSSAAIAAKGKATPEAQAAEIEKYKTERAPEYAQIKEINIEREKKGLAPLPVPELPASFIVENKKADKEAKTVLFGIDSKNASERQEAVIRIMDMKRDSIAPLPQAKPPTAEEFLAMSPTQRRAEEYRNSTDIISSAIERAYPGGAAAKASEITAKGEKQAGTAEMKRAAELQMLEQAKAAEQPMKPAAKGAYELQVPALGERRAEEQPPKAAGKGAYELQAPAALEKKAAEQPKISAAAELKPPEVTAEKPFFLDKFLIKAPEQPQAPQAPPREELRAAAPPRGEAAPGAPPIGVRAEAGKEAGAALRQAREAEIVSRPTAPEAPAAAAYEARRAGKESLILRPPEAAEAPRPQERGYREAERREAAAAPPTRREEYAPPTAPIGVRAEERAALRHEREAEIISRPTAPAEKAPELPKPAGKGAYELQVPAALGERREQPPSLPAAELKPPEVPKGPSFLDRLIGGGKEPEKPPAPQAPPAYREERAPAPPTRGEYAPPTAPIVGAGREREELLRARKEEILYRPPEPEAPRPQERGYRREPEGREAAAPPTRAEAPAEKPLEPKPGLLTGLTDFFRPKPHEEERPKEQPLPPRGERAYEEPRKPDEYYAPPKAEKPGREAGREAERGAEEARQRREKEFAAQERKLQEETLEQRMLKGTLEEPRRREAAAPPPAAPAEAPPEKPPEPKPGPLTRLTDFFRPKPHEEEQPKGQPPTRGERAYEEPRKPEEYAPPKYAGREKPGREEEFPTAPSIAPEKKKKGKGGEDKD